MITSYSFVLHTLQPYTYNFIINFLLQKSTCYFVPDELAMEVCNKTQVNYKLFNGNKRSFASIVPILCTRYFLNINIYQFDLLNDQN